MRCTSGIAAVVLLSAGVAYAQQCPSSEPASDSCASPRVISGSVGQHVVIMDASSATGTTTSCGRSMGKTVWFEVTPAVSGPMTISTCHSLTSYDTILQAYSGGNEECQGMTIEDCEDDSPGPWCDNACDYNGSEVTLNAVAGVRYPFEVGAYNDNSAECDLRLGVIVTIGTHCGNPSNNLFCSLAQVLPSGPGTHEEQANVTGANPSPSSWNCDTGPITVGHSVWYSVTPTVSGSLTFSTCDVNTTYDTVVRAWAGTCGGMMAQRACNDDIAGDPACYNTCHGAQRGSAVTI